MPLDVHATEEEDKLVVLSSLNRLGGCTEEQLLRFLVENALMNQFQFYLALGGLKEAGFIREARHLEGTLLILTPQGRESVEMFASRIRASQTEKLNANAPAWKRRIRDELQMPGAWQETDNGFAVALRALEGGAEIFSMTLTAVTKAQANDLRALVEPRAVSVSDDHGAARRGGKRRKKFVKPQNETKKKTKSKKTEINENENGKRGDGKKRLTGASAGRFCVYEKLRGALRDAWKRQKTIKQRPITQKVRKNRARIWQN